jgi:hypothetical protein
MSIEPSRYLLHSGHPVASPFGTYVRATDYDELAAELVKERAKNASLPADIDAAIDKVVSAVWQPLNPGVKVPADAQMLDGQWCFPLWGCDAVDHLRDNGTNEPAGASA